MESTPGAVQHNRAAERLLEPASTLEPFTDKGVREFHEELDGYAPTPVHSLDGIAKALGVNRVLLKDESSRFGLPSFKFLGVSWAIFRALVDREPGLNQDTASLVQLKAALPVLGGVTLFAATDGNHGLAVGRMGALLSVDAVDRVVVVQSELDYDGALREAAEAAHALGKAGVLIGDTSSQAYTQFPKRMAEGYITMFHEIDDQLGEDKSLDLIVVPVGVGSLAQTAITCYKVRHPDVANLAVEPDNAACLQASLIAGEPVSVKTSPTILSGLEYGAVSEIDWPVLHAGVDASVTVPDHNVHRALQQLRNDYSIQVGPCGGAALAAEWTFGRRQMATGLGRRFDDCIVIN